MRPPDRAVRYGSPLLLATLALFLLLPGCGGGQAGANPDGRVTITFWHSFVSSTIPALEKLIERFEREHPHIRINAQYIPTGDALVQKLVTAVQSRSAPDVGWIRNHYLEELVKADAIYPMSRFLNGPDGLTPAEVEDIYPALLQLASWQDTLYALPMEATNLGLLYNKDHFREVGLDPERPPQTWQELRDYALRLTLDRNGDGRMERVGFMVPVVPADGPQGPYMMWQFIPFLWGAGGYLIDLEQTQVLFDAPPGVQALTLWQDLYRAQRQQSFTSENLTVFASGQASMMLDGPWSLPRYPQILRGTDWGVAMLPEGPAKRATIVGGEYLSVFKQSAHPDEAWTFVKWMLQPEVQAFWAMESGYLPVRKSVLQVEAFRRYLDEHPAFRTFVEQMDYAQTQRPMDFHTIAIQRNLAIAIERATVGDQDPAAALREAAAASNRLLQSVAQRPTTP